MHTRRCPIEEHAKEHPATSAVIDDHQEYSYRTLDHDVYQRAATLTRNGTRTGDRVAIFSRNSYEYIVDLFAIWRLQAVAVLINTRLPAARVADQVHAIRCQRLLADLDLPETKLLSNMEPMRLVRDSSLTENRASIVTYDDDHWATIIFTSGTSATPKAAVHTFANHYINARGVNQHLHVGRKDRWLLSLPLFHVGGLSILWRMFLAGGTVVLPTVKTRVEDDVQRHSISHLSLVPTQLYRILQTPEGAKSLTNTKAVLVGGAPSGAALLERAVQAKIPLHATYGLTEMASQVATSTRLEPGMNPEGLIILDEREVMISPDSEILLKGPCLFSGYLRQDAINPSRRADGWFATGDKGHLNEQGQLIVEGRRDNMFISGGENIQPEEIERQLQDIEGVRQSVVVPVDDEEFGRRPVAFLDAEQTSNLTADLLRAELGCHLPPYKIPRAFYRWPMNAPEGSMKPSREEFLRIAQSGPNRREIP